MALKKSTFSGFKKSELSADEARVAWLGQAGFLVELGGQRIVIDPYLSDSLAEKYRGKKFPHVRMMPAPIQASELRDIDWILCTHGHTDHMDPGTLPELLAANPKAQVVVPRAELNLALSCGVPALRVHTIDAGEELEIDGFRVKATPAAHEDLARDPEGHYKYLGYILENGGPRIWHSGDTIPFDGLSDLVTAAGIDLGLLPVNGRDELRQSNGVPGNFTAAEALELIRSSGMKSAILHHFGMFDFNSADPIALQNLLDAEGMTEWVALASTENDFKISGASRARKRVLAVCRGNICRSPTAHALLERSLNPREFEVDSAALEDWNVGRPPHEQTTAIAAAHGIDVSAQTARQVRPEDFDAFDIILGMDEENMAGLQALRPVGSTASVAHIGAFLEFGRVLDVIDPYGFDDSVFEDVFLKLEQAVDSVAWWIK